MQPDVAALQAKGHAADTAGARTSSHSLPHKDPSTGEVCADICACACMDHGREPCARKPPWQGRCRTGSASKGERSAAQPHSVQAGHATGSATVAGLRPPSLHTRPTPKWGLHRPRVATPRLGLWKGQGQGGAPAAVSSAAKGERRPPQLH